MQQAGSKMKDVSIQSTEELLQSLDDYKKADTHGREPDKDYIFNGYVVRICGELNRRGVNHVGEYK